MLRQFRRNRTFSLVIIGLLGLGIGSVTLVFGLVNEMLLKPLPVRNPQNLYLLERMGPNYLRPDTSFSDRQFREVVARSPLVTAAAAELIAAPQYLVPIRENGTTRLALAQIVSPNYFAELGIRPFAGRLLDEADTKPAAALPVVLSYQFWQSQFGGETAVLGRTIRLKDAPFTIVGVLPRGFHSSDVDRAPDIRLPMPAGAVLFGPDPDSLGFQILIRLAPGVSPLRAASAMLPELRRVAMETALELNSKRKDPSPPEEIRKDEESWTAILEPIERGSSRLRAQFADALRLLLAGVCLLLLAVCANVAGLLIAQSAGRRKELGIRAALGARRWEIQRQLLFENLMLAAPGAVLGACFAWLLAPQVVRLLPPIRDFAQFASPQLLVVTPDLRVLAVAAGATMFCVLAAGLIPAWRASRMDVLVELKTARDRGGSARAGIAAVAVQVGFCAILLSAAALMLRSYRKLDRLDAGFDRAHIVEFTLNPASAGYGMKESGAFFAGFRARVAGLPGVRSAAWAWRGVMRGVGIKTTLSPEGIVLPKGTFLNTSLNEVTPGYFETMGLPLLAGRDLRFSDFSAQPAPVVINQAFADQLLPRQNPLGKVLLQGIGGSRRGARLVVGVVPAAKYRSMREPDPPTVYGLFNETNGSDWQVVLYVRTYGAPAGIVSEVRQVLREFDPGVPLEEALTLDSEIRNSLWQERLVAILSAFFGIASVSLAAVGLYGALAVSVAHRRRELGIRIAMGARLRHVLRAVCSPMAAGVGCGLAAGLAASAWLLRLTRALLYGVEPLDPVSLASAVALVLACSIVAAAPPAWRATRVDPGRALRDE